MPSTKNPDANEDLGGVATPKRFAKYPKVPVSSHPHVMRQGHVQFVTRYSGKKNAEDRLMTFFHIPKSGGTSMRQYIQTQIPTSLFINYGTHRRVNLLKPRQSGFTWCIARNPWEQYVSFYEMTLKNDRSKKSFEQFVSFISQTDLEDWSWIWKKCNYIAQFDNMVDDLEKMFSSLDYPFHKDRFEKSWSFSNKDYIEYYNVKTKDMVYKVHKETIDYFNYEF